ncbi:hypothetical protein [Pseudoalteromonas sp. 10-33]|uniref:hypothetical protein n=1 Tax=Pseudoalteromonas sp. 10-33 TaxID=1761890 RepID=UPI000732187C|nr:hypothetical protein [Pseudoalteromonas sp. 10-33]KTF19193.1 hypothetical protein ATS76_00730 [Pseudoalteromonas sp. 10-33]
MLINSISKFMFNFTPMILSLLIMQVFILPDLFLTSKSEYLFFNFLLYSALLYIHIFNTACFNEQAISYSGNGQKIDILSFFVFFLIYFFICVLYSVLQDSSFSIFIFLILLYPVDFCVNALRLVEKDKAIGMLLTIQAVSFYILYTTSAINVFDSYTVANLITFIVFLFIVDYKKFNASSFVFSLKRFSFFLSVSIPTLNRYLDKVFVLVFLALSLKASIYPYLALSGLILLPLSVASKVLMRSYDVDYPIKKYCFALCLFFPFLLLIIFLLNYFGVRLIYEQNDNIGFSALIIISAFKAFNFLEILTFSIYSKKLDFQSLSSKVSKCLSLITFILLLLGYVINVSLPEGSLLFLCGYFFISFVLLVLSIKGDK